MVFFAIWWAWMNFTWFATSFDTDDWLYRVLTIVQMGGVLVLAAGVEPAFVDHDFTVVVLGYVVMRVAMVAQWLRASRTAGPARRRRPSTRSASPVSRCCGSRSCCPAGRRAVIALRRPRRRRDRRAGVRRAPAPTPWHPHHITERYGLFTLILLGESLLASANAIIEALHDDDGARAADRRSPS